jgi:hypothetical protein
MTFHNFSNKENLILNGLMGSAEEGIFLALLLQMLGPTFVFDWHHLIWAKSPC